MYKVDTNVRYSECGEDGKIKLGSIINQFQDASSAHSESLGVGMDYLTKKKRAWFLNSWQIVIERYPDAYEPIEVSTWPTGFNGVFGPRNFCMKTPAGEMLAYANSLWVYVETETGKPAKPDEEEKQIYGVEPPLEMEYAPRKIKMPEMVKVVDTITVRKYHIDTNSHMNNAQYAQMAMEVMPDGYKPKQIRVEYKKSAVYGDKIVLKLGAEEERTVVVLCDEMDKVYAVAEFIGE